MEAAEWLIARNLSAALLAGEWTAESLGLRAEAYLGAPAQEPQRLLIAELTNISASYPPSPDWLARFFLSSPAFKSAIEPLRKNGGLPPIVLSPACFAPSPPLAGLNLPALATPGDLARWLDLPIGRLDWLADSRRQHGATATPVLQHYFYTFIPKRTGSPRLIEAPKPQLRAIQRRILREILDLAPAHDRAYGFVRGRSCLDAAQQHAGEFLVVTLDLKDFFASVPASRVHGIFRSLGYPWAVARLLTGLCVTCTPPQVFDRQPDGALCNWDSRKRFGAPHLPQGAPASPALANLAARRLDLRLTGLADCFGARFTRYADDLAFSGGQDFARKIELFLDLAEQIIGDERFALNARKTRVMRQSRRQRITGVVVNSHLNLPRAAYDELKATLHNCVKLRPESQNRAGAADFRAHLDGRVRWAETLNPQRGAKLRRIFEAIRW